MAAGYSVDEFAELAAAAMGRERPFATSAIRNQENGTNGFGAASAQAYARVLGCDPQFILFGTGNGVVAPAPPPKHFPDSPVSMEVNGKDPDRVTLHVRGVEVPFSVGMEVVRMVNEAMKR